MEISGVILCVLMISPTPFVEAGLNPENDNVCLKTVTYRETIKETAQRPEPKKETIPCSKEGKYCDEEIIIGMKEPRVIVRTKIVPSCCEGYEESPDGTQCVAVCPNGCGNGICVSPGNCSCEPGFFGQECDRICDEGKWGENCAFSCNCSENEDCNRISGCICKPGWMGDRCATPCPEGYYGFLCEKKCPCDTIICSQLTGTCVKPTKAPTVLPVSEESKVKEKTIISNADVVTNETSLNLTSAEDTTVTDGNSSLSAAKDERFDQNFTVIFHENAEAVTFNFTASKPDVKEDDSKDSENPGSGYGINFKPVSGLEDREPILETSTVTHTTQGAKAIDILKELTRFGDSGKNVLHRNELYIPASDHQNTEGGHSSPVSNFIPTVSVLSGIAALILLILGKWLIVTIRKKIKKTMNVELGISDEELSILPTERFIWENSFENPVPVPDIVRTTPVLQTFKPEAVLPDNSTEKKIPLTT